MSGDVILRISLAIAVLIIVIISSRNLNGRYFTIDRTATFELAFFIA
jgi:hypothetical protein